MAPSATTIDPYKELPLIKNQRLKLNSASPFTPTYVQSNLTQSSDPSGVYASRIRGRLILLENPVRESKVRKERAAKKARRNEAKKRKALGVIGRKEANEKGLWRLEKCQTRFNLFLPLHHLWLGYMSELLGLSPRSSSNETPQAKLMPGAAGMHAKLVKADFHGSIMTVRQSKNPCLVGVSGIVIHETENVFKVVTKKDQLKLIPKQNTIFVFAVPLYSTLHTASPDTAGIVPANSSSSELATTILDDVHIEFELYGNQFCFRSAERAGRKFKHKETVEL